MDFNCRRQVTLYKFSHEPVCSALISFCDERFEELEWYLSHWNTILPGDQELGNTACCRAMVFLRILSELCMTRVPTDSSEPLLKCTTRAFKILLQLVKKVQFNDLGVGNLQRFRSEPTLP